MAKSDKRIKVHLKCSECNRKNYSTYKNKQNSTEKLKLSKYCPFDRKHTEHREVK